MAKIIYHLGTGTYFGLDNDVVVIDTEEVSEDIDGYVMERFGNTIAKRFGKRITNIITEDN